MTTSRLTVLGSINVDYIMNIAQFCSAARFFAQIGAQFCTVGSTEKWAFLHSAELNAD